VELKQKFHGRKMTVEVDSVKDAWSLAEAGVDIIQLDKVPLPELGAFVPAFKQRYPMAPRLAAAGGITRENVKEYAALGVDLLVTSSPYSGKPADITARMIPLETGSARNA
jgi:molybdenum transport protein